MKTENETRQAEPQDDESFSVLDKVELYAADLSAVIDVLALLMQEQQGCDRFGTLCVIQSQLERILDSLNGLAGELHDDGGVNPAAAITAQEELLTDTLDSFPYDSASKESLGDLNKAGELMSRARELVSKANGSGANAEH